MDNLKALKTVAIVSLAVLAIVAFALGFYPLEESARRGGIGIPILLPVLIDLGLVLMGLGAMAARANRLTAWPMRVMAVVLILVSALVQYFHAAAQADVTPIDIVVAVLPPIVLWAASSAVETLLFGRSVENAVTKADQDAAKAAARAAAKLAPKPQPTAKPKLAEAKQSSPKHVETAKPTVQAKPVKAEVKPEPVKKPVPKAQIASVSDETLQEAIQQVLAGKPLSTVAKQYGINRSTLGRKTEAFKEASAAREPAMAE